MVDLTGGNVSTCLLNASINDLKEESQFAHRRILKQGEPHRKSKFLKSSLSVDIFVHLDNVMYCTEPFSTPLHCADCTLLYWAGYALLYSTILVSPYFTALGWSRPATEDSCLWNVAKSTTAYKPGRALAYLCYPAAFSNTYMRTSMAPHGWLLRLLRVG